VCGAKKRSVWRSKKHDDESPRGAEGGRELAAAAGGRLEVDVLVLRGQHDRELPNALPKAKSQAKDKRAKDRQKYAALRCKVGLAPPSFEVRWRMSRVAFRVFPAGRAGDTRAAIYAISCFVSRSRVCVYFLCERSRAAQGSENS
jgi:hypothetical protein